MNENTPMTPAQQLFAEEHHNLVYAFLNEKKLPEDEYYDVVVFGYLQAVMDYTTQGESSRFSFATIAWRKMESRLADHFRHQASTKRAAPTVSLNAVMDDAGLPLAGIIPEDPCVTLAASFGKPLLRYAPRCPAAKACRRIAKRVQGFHEPIALR